MKTKAVLFLSVLLTSGVANAQTTQLVYDVWPKPNAPVECTNGTYLIQLTSKGEGSLKGEEDQVDIYKSDKEGYGYTAHSQFTFKDRDFDLTARGLQVPQSPVGYEIASADGKNTIHMTWEHRAMPANSKLPPNLVTIGTLTGDFKIAHFNQARFVCFLFEEDGGSK